MSNYKHGEAANRSGKVTPEYRAWSNMIRRCIDPNAQQYKNYGARGIKVCQEWRESYTSFLYSIGRRPTSKHSIARIDNSGNYEPGNVRWDGPKAQCRNRRGNRIIEFNGLSLTVAEWTERKGFRKNLIIDRLQRGWSIEQALSTPTIKAA
jgi:hypothetical protein